jgi:NAD+ synthase (glutamine-hydrolysing)
VTYENCQARERTQVLMDYANKVGGIVLGTGDLSELALGWCTYNADHMSMYNVNGGVPKSLVKSLIRWYADQIPITNDNKDWVLELGNVLHDILDTPVSPELLPNQVTENSVGPYELHEFFLYHILRSGWDKDTLLSIATNTFSDTYSIPEIKKWMNVFYKRFFTQQFKRNCLPDGPKVGTVSLSPRGDWRMPSDIQSVIKI